LHKVKSTVTEIVERCINASNKMVGKICTTI